MTIKLKASWLDEIRPHLIEGLRQIRVNNGMFLDRSSNPYLAIADFKIPEHSPVRKELEACIDEFPLLEFVTDTLARELYDRDKYEKDVERVPLTEIDGYFDPEATADRLLQTFQTLPWDYLITLRLPHGVTTFAPETDYKVAEDIWLRRGGTALEARAPLANLPDDVSRRVKGTGLLSLMIGSGPKWEPDALYLQVNVKGFIGPYGDSQPYRTALAKIKSFFGLLIAVNGVHLRPRTFGAEPTKDLYIHKASSDGFIADNKLELDGLTSALIDRTVAWNNNGKMEDESVIRRWLLADLEKVSKVFRDTEKCSALVLAGQWFFDSQIDPNPLVTYIRSMVVLEILLGSQKDAKELSIGDLIANRCAYLIGKDFEERARIINNFKRIYSIRSQIVHRGKAQLTLEERSLLTRLQWMGRRVIQEEIARIPSNHGEPK